jgi:predicted amidophosphoribosyltransferase
MNIKNYFRRKENMRSVFSAEGGPSCLKNKNVLLVDDVATTGATLFECARILKQNGAKKVFGVVVARQEMT